MQFNRMNRCLFIVCLTSACDHPETQRDSAPIIDSTSGGDTIADTTETTTDNETTDTQVPEGSDGSCREPSFPSGANSSEPNPFEGESEDNSCLADEDCATSGCGGEVCAAASVDIVTDCEWAGPQCDDIPCDCGCVDNTCVWYMERCKQEDDANGQWFAVTVLDHNLDCDGAWNVKFTEDNMDQVASLLGATGANSESAGIYAAYHLPEAYQQYQLSIEIRIAIQKSDWWCRAQGPGLDHLVVVEAR